MLNKSTYGSVCPLLGHSPFFLLYLIKSDNLSKAFCVPVPALSFLLVSTLFNTISVLKCI